MNVGQNCRIGSAWYDWQHAGHDWHRRNPDARPETAAREFADVDGWPDIGRDARYRAFLEGVAADPS